MTRAVMPPRGGGSLRSLAALVRALRRRYGPPRTLAPKEPFRLLLWEYVAYLTDEPTRARAYRELKSQVGIRPEEVAGASLATLAAIARRGSSIAVAQRAQRLRSVAASVRDDWGGSLAGVLRLPYAEARRALMSFPSIGPPGADKILLLTGSRPILALDSNALRTLLRLGYGREQKSYAASYHSAQGAAMAALPGTVSALRAAFLLLQRHGQETCRRTVPRCSMCPLQEACPSAVRWGG